MNDFPGYMGENPGFGAGSEFRWKTSCPQCQLEYSPIEARIVAEKEGGYMLFHECDRCRNAIVSVLVEENDGITSMGLVTDMTYYDAARFKESQSVTSDQILDAYVSLKEFNKERKAVESASDR